MSLKKEAYTRILITSILLKFNYRGDQKSNHLKCRIFLDWISNSSVFNGSGYIFSYR